MPSSYDPYEERMADYWPPRHRDENDEYDFVEPLSRDDPRRTVKAPGTALLIVGILGIIASMLFGAFATTLIARGVQNPRNGAGEEDIEVGTIFAMMSLVGMLGSAVLAAGGVALRQCRHYRRARTAAILAIGSIVFLSFLGAIVLPIGVWALVVLGRPKVKAEFLRNQFRAIPDWPR